MLLYSATTRGVYDTGYHHVIPGDAQEISSDELVALFAAQVAGQRIAPDANGNPVAVDPPPPTQAQLIAQYASAVQAHLDAQAIAMGYDSIFTAVTYADEPAVAKFQTEGQALRAWRSNVWESCYATLAAVQGGASMPTDAELLAGLPAFVAPA